VPTTSTQVLIALSFLLASVAMRSLHGRRA
jgi:hypothetical protein